MTLADIYPRWLTHQRDTVIDTRRITASWKHFAGLHKLTPKQLTPAALEKERDRLLRTLSSSTVRRSLADMLSFAHWMAAEKLMDTVVTIRRPRESRPRQRWLTKEEMQSLIEVGRRVDIPLWFDWVLNLSFLTGQRISAVLELQWDQISDGIVDFNRGINARCKRRGIVPVTATIKAILDECPRQSRYVLTSGDGRVTLRQFRCQWKKACKLAGIVGAVPHTMRHSVASQLVSNGVSLQEVSRLLGHSSISITERVYAKYAPDYTRRASDAMAALLTSP